MPCYVIKLRFMSSAAAFIARGTSMFSEETRNACNTVASWGTAFWTAGQRVDPNSESTFVWRVTSSGMNRNSTTPMSYTNWGPGEPSYTANMESCMHIMSVLSYAWNDIPCDRRECPVCELDI